MTWRRRAADTCNTEYAEFCRLVGWCIPTFCTTHNSVRIVLIKLMLTKMTQLKMAAWSVQCQLWYLTIYPCLIVAHDFCNSNRVLTQHIIHYKDSCWERNTTSAKSHICFVPAATLPLFPSLLRCKFSYEKVRTFLNY